MSILIAESTAPLLERMAQELSLCRNPWARHWLVLPGGGRSEWLQRRWARISGIAAHSQIVSLRSLIEQAASPDAEPFSRERLVLAVALALPTLRRQMPLPKSVDCAVVDARVLSWAQQLADAIDLGLLCRGPLDCPFSSTFLTELLEHPAVKSALSGHLGTLQEDEFHRSAKRWVDKWQERGGAPFLWLQLDAGLPHVLLRSLSVLLQLVPERSRLSLLNPSRTFWGDLRTRQPWTEGQDAGPVLSPLGRQAQDLHHQAVEHFLSQGTGGEELPPLTSANTLLGWLQSACHEAAAPASKALLEDDDWSFTVHACRSPLRELEISRDRILQAMSAEPSLGMNDILVLLADPATHAPLVGAAFAPLPARVLGLGGAAMSPVASGLLRLVKSLGGRLTLSDLQALIEEPLIAERFGFADQGRELLDWLEQAQFRWGLDAEQRAEVQGEGESRWNLDFALRRLGLGAITSSACRDGVVDGAAPLERAAGLSTALLARLAQFATALYEARIAWIGGSSDESARPIKPLAEWCARLTEWCEQFFAVGTGVESEHRTQLVNSLLPSLQTAAPEGLLLGSDAVVRLLEKLLESLTLGHGAAGGGITVADLSHYAGTPAKLIVVVGLGTEQFPRHEERPDWHPLSMSRRAGDPDRRDADRHALLLSLLAAEERLVLTYQGGSDADGKERPPSTPLADLLSAVDVVAARADGEKPSSFVWLKHGLNGFSPAACAEGTRPVARSHLPSDYSGARALLERQGDPYPGLWSEALPPTAGAEPLTLGELNDLVREPCRIFLRRLGLRLPEAVEEPHQEDPLALDALARWSLRDRMLGCQLRGDTAESLLGRAEAAGELPRGLYGSELWEATLKELPKLEETGLLPVAENVEVILGDRRLTATLPAGWYRRADGSVVYCTASSRSGRKLLEIRLALLYLTLSEGTSSVQAWFQKKTQPDVLFAPSRPEAEALLSQLCRLHGLAEQLPLPFWGGTYEKMRELDDRSRKPGGTALSREQLLLSAWTEWNRDGSPGVSAPPTCQLPATRACFRGLKDPFTWTPNIEVDWLPEPDAPLAYRLFRFVSGWEAVAGGHS